MSLAALAPLPPGELPDPTGRPAWHQHAACRGLGTATFYGPDPTEGKSVCEQCPVTNECRAQGRREKWGIWAGETEKERGRHRVELAL